MLTSDGSTNKVKTLTNISTIFAAPEQKSFLNSSKNSIPKEHEGRVVYLVSCSGSQTHFFYPTVQNLQTWLNERMMKTAPVGDLLENRVQSSSFTVKIFDQSADRIKLVALEVLHNSRLKPDSNTR